jgi:autotransporter-associated beta strand protein
MGIGVAPAMVNLGAGTTFDYSGVSQTGGRGVTTVAGGGTFSVSNANTNLTLTGNVSGPTINKAGPGTLTLAGPVAFSGTTQQVQAALRTELRRYAVGGSLSLRAARSPAWRNSLGGAASPSTAVPASDRHRPQLASSIHSLLQATSACLTRWMTSTTNGQPDHSE